MQKFFIIFCLFFITAVSSGFVFAAGESGYQPLAPIPGLTDPTTIPTGTSNGQSGIGFAGYLRALYVWGVSAASGLAVVMIMWGGVEYMTSAGGGGVEEAKKRISAAIMGLLLALGSYIILSAVNKDLLNLQFEIGDLKVDVNGNAPVKVITPQYSQPSSLPSLSSPVRTNAPSSLQPSASPQDNNPPPSTLEPTLPAPTSDSTGAPNPLFPSLNQKKTALPGQ